MEERLDKLESQLAFQEDVIDKLNKVVTGQQDQIDALRKEIERLREEMPQTGAVERDPVQERPPHY